MRAVIKANLSIAIILKANRCIKEILKKKYGIWTQRSMATGDEAWAFKNQQMQKKSVLMVMGLYGSKLANGFRPLALRHADRVACVWLSPSVVDGIYTHTYTHTHTQTNINGRQSTQCVIPRRHPHAGAVNIYCKANREKKIKQFCPHRCFHAEEPRGRVGECTLWETLSARRGARGDSQTWRGDRSVEITAREMTVWMMW